MSFELKNTLGTFQRAKDVILSAVKWQVALVYLEDIVIFPRSPHDYVNHVTKVLSLLRDAGVILKLKRWIFFTRTIDYLSHVICPRHVGIATLTTATIKDPKPSTNITELRSFLGLCNVFRRFVPNFARITAPLNNKLKIDQPKNFVDLTAEEQHAMHKNQEQMVSPPIIELPNAREKYKLNIVACSAQVVCVLLQEQLNGTTKPVGYWSRSPAKAKLDYNTTQPNCLAIAWSVLMLRPYLEGKRFTIRTDHD